MVARITLAGAVTVLAGAASVAYVAWRRRRAGGEPAIEAHQAGEVSREQRSLRAIGAAQRLARPWRVRARLVPDATPLPAAAGTTTTGCAATPRGDWFEKEGPEGRVGGRSEEGGRNTHVGGGVWCMVGLRCRDESGVSGELRQGEQGRLCVVCVDIGQLHSPGHLPHLWPHSNSESGR